MYFALFFHIVSNIQQKISTIDFKELYISLLLRLYNSSITVYHVSSSGKEQVISEKPTEGFGGGRLDELGGGY